MINYLQVENLTKSYGDLVLFDNISFTIGEGQRIALIGRNGSGKTTLLNILAGKDTADSGTITPRRDLRIAYLEQNPEYAADLTVLEACFRSDNPALRAIAAYEQAVADPAQDGLQEAMSRMDALAAWDYEQRAKEILSRLKINDFDKKIGQLSGGQLKRVALAAVLISEADLLILDEPTNHLDTDMTEWLEEYLTRNKAALLMVTHDRYFLDRVCSDILEVDQRSVCLYKGNYAYYVEKKQERAEAAEARRESDLNLYRRELEWMRRQPQARATKARARIDSFHELDARLKSTRTQASLKLDVQATRIGTKIFEAKELCKRFGDLVILDRFNYNFARYDKLGIVGDNGCGKSTFLKLLTGIERPDSGTIEVGESVRFGYYSQQGLDFDEGKKVIDIVTDIAHEIHLGDGRRMSASQFLQYFLFPPEVQYSYVARLSGGERKRLYLCTILIQSPNFLILDEPTNDLDIVTLGVLEEYLQAFKGCVIVVSHDRYFLDRVCSEIIEIDNRRIYQYKGNYSYYLEKREERIEAKTVEIERANNLYRTELEWMRRMPQARGHKARYREDAFYELEKVAKQRFNNDNVKLDVKASYIGSKIFEADHLYKSFGDLKILDDFSYIFARYEKMGIVGNNGTGKSTFIKILMGQELADSGTLDIGETVRFGYYSQEGLQFDEQMKVIDVVQDIAEVIELGNGKRLTASQFLQHFLFTPETQHSYVYKLSGGERRRLYLCTVLMRNPNFLVLDEPTNDLDIVTLNVLEEYLQNFKGCVIVVSHDRYFMDKVVDHLLVFNGQGDIRDFPGNYTQYRDWKDVKAAQEKEKEKEAAKTQEEKTAKVRLNEKRRMSFKEKREFEQLEQEIAALEAEKQSIEEALCSGALSVEELTEKSKRLPELTDLIDEKTMRWLELSEIESN